MDQLATSRTRRTRGKPAIALYTHFFSAYVSWIGTVPQWVWAMVALALVLALNVVSVKVFGEMEFWFALIKVAGGA